MGRLAGWCRDDRVQAVALGAGVGVPVMWMPAGVAARLGAAVFLFVFAAGGWMISRRLRHRVGKFAALAAVGLYCATLLVVVLTVEGRPVVEYPAVWLTGLFLPFVPYFLFWPPIVVVYGSRRLWGAARRRRMGRHSDQD